MVTTRDNYEHFIHEVESCSIAEHAGLQIGDHLETINGISVTGKTHSSVVKILSKYKTTVNLEIIRSHSTHSKRVFYC